ncbi:hypothetical protein [Brucella sp.]|nr:hypothetical protein [Brucella sp.]
MKAIIPVAWLITGFLMSMALKNPSDAAGLAFLCLCAAIGATIVDHYSA